MRPLQIYLTLALMGLFLLSGCPDTTATPPLVDEVEVQGSLRTSSFTLVLRGHGLGLKALRYDVNEGAGGGDVTHQLYVKLKGTTSNLEYNSSPSNTTPRSPNEIEARFNLGTGNRMEPGSYFVKVMLDRGETVDEITSEATSIVLEVLPDDEPDAGVVDAGPDAGPVDAGDAGTLDAGDAGLDAGVDAGPTDLGIDAGPPDSGVVDSGLGGFKGGYDYRQTVTVVNNAAGPLPADVTVRIPINHAQLVAAGQSKPDATDIAVYLGSNRLEHQLDDRLAVGTDRLALIALLPVATSTGHVLGLYYGDPAATVPTNDAVFLFVERFDVALPATWFINGWGLICFDRNPNDQGARAICVLDGTDNPTRRTVGSPNVAAIRDAANTPANTTYEINAWLAGIMGEQQDLLYFSYSDTNQNFPASVLIPTMDYVAFPPNATTTFQETTGANRTEPGWRLPVDPGQPFTRSMARFIPTVDQPSLHYRYISPNGVQNPDTVVAVDDLWVRRAAEPEASVSFGAVEVRP